jgi:E3 ubiquitin ligase
MVTFLILLLFAIIFLVAGGALLYFRQKTKQKAALMGQTETSGAADVSGLAPGTVVEVKGTLRCEEPLTSEMAGETCAYYSARVVREYLERDYDDDDDVGSDRRSEVVAHNEQFAPFSVEDETGSVPVNAEGAEVDARQVVNRFERNTGGNGPSISLGGATIHLGGGERTLGYRYTESILPVNAPVYVLGSVQENGGIGAPPPGDNGQQFVVSQRSEEALGQSLGKTVLWLGVGGIAALVVGIILLVVGGLVLLG